MLNLKGCFLFGLLITLSNSSNGQATIDCFMTPDGTDRPWAVNWSYKEYVIPSGYKIDSVYGGFSRPAYLPIEHDYIFAICEGTTTFDVNTAIGYDINTTTEPFNYSLVDTSLYNYWINLTSFNYIGESVVHVYLPTNAGAIWNDLCFAISPNIAMGLKPSIVNDDGYLKLSLNEEVIKCQVYDLIGRTVFESNNEMINLTELNLEEGIYQFVFYTNTNVTTKKIHLNQK